MPDKMPTFGQEPSEDLIDRLKSMVLMRDKLASLNTAVDALKAQILETETKCFSMMESLGVTSMAVNVDGRKRTAFTKVDLYMSLNAENKEHAEKWLKVNGYSDLFKETINSRTMTTALKEFKNEGGEIPEDLINQKLVNRVSTRR